MSYLFADGEKMENKNNVTLYNLNPSQEVSKLQCKYTLFKRVINILTSMTTKDNLDFEIMKNAINKVIERNDCLRIKFVKQGKELMQYFAPYTKIDVPVLTFNTQKEQEAFINKTKKKAIKYMKGVVFEPYLIKTFDDKYMVFLKVCHMVLDIYGISVIFKDIFEVYDALKNGKELPEPPASFEEIVKKDLEKKRNEISHQKHKEFFTEYLKQREEPYYAGVSADACKIWNKRAAKNKRAMKMFFIKNDTVGYARPMNKALTARVMEYCQKNQQSPASFLFYTTSLCASKMNKNAPNMLPLELCNCRATAAERKCAGTKVQSLGCYTNVDQNKTFVENFAAHVDNHNTLFRHISFPDQDFEVLMHKIYGSSVFSTYYSITYSFIPFALNGDLEFQVYSNEKGALPAYVAHLYNAKTGEMTMVYDVQSKIITEKDVDNFHKNYEKVIAIVLDNPDIMIKDIKI